MQERMSRNTMGDKINATSHGIQIHVEKHAWTKMNGWCKAANGEVSGLGLCTIEDGVFTIREVFLPKQYGSSGYTELDDHAVGKLNYRLHKKGIQSDMIRFWWHTHYNFGVFWSGTDDDNAQRLAKENGDWEVSIVINQAGQYRARIDFVKPIDLTVDEIEVFLIPNSKRVKRKRNYKNDIQRWVRPLSEMPSEIKAKEERDKWKSTGSEQGYRGYTGYDDYSGYGGDNGGMSDWWNSFNRKEDKATGKLTPDEEKIVEKIDKVENSKRFGRYVLHKGKLMSVEAYDALIAADVSKNQVSLKTVGACECGSVYCQRQLLCDECKNCGKRTPSYTWQCKHCEESRWVDRGGKKEKKECPCAHAGDGKWENCDCDQDCDVCLKLIH